MDHKNHEENKMFPIITLAAGIILILSAFIFRSAKNILLIIATFICSLPITVDAFERLKRKEIDESALLIIASAAAIAIGEYSEAAAVTALFCIGELLEDFASDRSRKSIESLFGIISTKANKVNDDGTVTEIDADEIICGMKIAVMPHEIIPADGIIYNGNSEIDTSALTGESLPKEVGVGSKIMSGCINGNNTIYFKATAEKKNSAAQRIAEMVDKAAEDKGRAQNLIASFAKYYTPAIVFSAILIAVIPAVIFGNRKEWIYKALVLLVASCPCALVLSSPLAFFSSMGACARNGIIIKGSRYIEALAKADTAAFDKTGTLTSNKLCVGEIICSDGCSSDEILKLASICESSSTHPIAKAIVSASGNSSHDIASEITEIPSGGTSALIPEGKILCGGKRFMETEGIDISHFPDSPVYVALNGRAIGSIEITSEIRDDSKSTVEALNKLGFSRIAVLSGDRTEQVEKICSLCGIDEFRSELLPGDKLDEIIKMKKSSRGLIYIGDGINDSPVLRSADVGVAMGLGTRTAAESADIILTGSKISKLTDAIIQSRRTIKVLKINIFFVILIKLAVIILGITGIAPMWSAVLADVGTMIICVVNSSRLLMYNKNPR